MGDWSGERGSSDQAGADEDDAGGELNPGEVAFGGAVEAAGDAAELGQEVVAALHGVADLAHAWLLLAPLGGPQAEAGGLGPLLARLVAIPPVGPRPGQVALVEDRGRRSRPRRVNDHRLEDLLGLH